MISRTRPAASRRTLADCAPATTPRGSDTIAAAGSEGESHARMPAVGGEVIPIVLVTIQRRAEPDLSPRGVQMAKHRTRHARIVRGTGQPDQQGGTGPASPGQGPLS